MRKVVLLAILSWHTLYLFGQEANDLTKALDYFEQAAVAYENDETDSLDYFMSEGRAYFLEAKVDSAYLQAGLGLTQAFYRWRDYEKGISLLLQIEKDLKVTMGTHGEFWIDMNYQLARGYYYLLEVESCVQRIQTNLPLLDSSSVLYANHLNIMGLILYKSSQYQRALPIQKKVVELRKELYGSESNSVATILNNISNTYDALGLLNQAYNCVEEGISIRESIYGEKDFRLVSLLMNLGTIYLEIGQYPKSLACFEEALHVLDEAEDEQGNEELTATVYINQAIALKHLGALEESKLSSQQAEKILEKIESEDKNILLGDIYLNLVAAGNSSAVNFNNLEKSAKYYEQSLDEQHPKRVNVANNLAIEYAETGDYSKAREVLNHLIGLIGDNSDFTSHLSNIYNDLADTYLATADFVEAEKYNNLALDLQKALYPDGHYRLAYTYNNLAKIALDKGDLSKVNDYLDLALSNNQASDLPTQGYSNYQYYLESLLLKGRCNSTSAALAYYEVADQLISKLRNELSAVGDKLALADFSYRLSKQAIEACLENRNDPTAVQLAYYYSEQSKANVLSQLLAINQGKSFAGIPDSLIRKEEELLANIHYYQLQLAEEAGVAQMDLFEDELFGARTAHAELVEHFESNYPAYHDLKYKSEVPSLSDLQNALEENTVIVSYFTTEDKIYTFLIHPGNVAVFEKEVDADFFTFVKGFGKTISLQLDEDYATYATQLYDDLMDFKLPKSTQRLIIIPDSKTSQIPFGALLQKKVKTKALSQMDQLPYLINNYEISYAPSARLFYNQHRQKAVNYDNDLLAYAPVFSTPQPITDFGAGQRTRLSSNVQIMRSLVNDRDEISPLPATLSELENIAKVFDQRGKKAKAYLYDKATEYALKKDLNESHRFIHIATHGFVNTEQPDYSGLIFHRQEGEQEDNVLYSAEIYSLKFNADLVALSACETGLGETVEGEGLLGLSRAFTYAGARNLMVSLWKIQDQATSDLMVNFYNAYWSAPSQNYSSALREAKLGLINSERYAHPYYWSSFILLGQ